MLTQCPSCQTTFRVTSEILRVAYGQVRCGRCQTQFDATERLIEETDDGVTESGRYMRQPRQMQPPPPSPGQIDVEEPIEHEDITATERYDLAWAFGDIGLRNEEAAVGARPM